MSQETHPEAVNGGDSPDEKISISMLSAILPTLTSTSFSPIASHHEVPPSQLEQDQTSQGPSGPANCNDSSGPFFNMYIRMTEGEDNKMSQRWQKDADGILIFVSPYYALHTKIQWPTCIL
jgi:hypothetical protein